MNYRHAYHAGNFADAVKHWAFVTIIEYLKLKDKPFFLLDTHAGPGSYRLEAEMSERTGEWRGGIGRLMAAIPGGEAAKLLAPYIECVEEARRARGGASVYPGSPEIARRLLRANDRLSLFELHPADGEQLQRRMRGAANVKVYREDGWSALKSELPPKERRGLALIDPPFENADEFESLTDALIRALQRWSTGIFMAWYPMKDANAVGLFHNRLVASGIPKLLRLSLDVDAPLGLSACGLVIANPPFTLKAEADCVLPALAATLAQGANPRWQCQWLARE